MKYTLRDINSVFGMMVHRIIDGIVTLLLYRTCVHADSMTYDVHNKQ